MSTCFPICPRKRTYLPILELLPRPALGERRHRGLAHRFVAVRRAADVADELRELREQRQRERPFSVVK